MSRASIIRWLGNLGLLVGSVITVFGMLEAGLRLTGISDARPTPPPIYDTSDNPEISYALKPSISVKAFRNMVTTNAMGFRSPEIVEDTPLIAVLGDSITFGYGVADTETLGARLQQELDDQYQVLNAAVPGYTILQEAATYEQKISPLHPDALVLVYYWNDIEDMTPAVLTKNGNLVLPGDSDDIVCNPVNEGILGWIPGRCWLDLHSSLYRAVKKVVSARKGQKNLAAQTEQLKSTPFTEHVPAENLITYEQTFDRLVQNLPPDMPRLFVIWPEKALHFTYRPQIRAMAEARGFRVLDLYEVFGNEAQTLSWDTVHPAPETLSEAASVIAAVMREWDLLPE